MPSATNQYQLPYPAGADKWKTLPVTMQALAQKIDDTLHTFDYNGADPDSFTATLASLVNRVTALEQADPPSPSPASGSLQAGTAPVPAQTGQVDLDITFPTPFTATPVVVAMLRSTVGAAASGYINYVVAASATGFTFDFNVAVAAEDGDLVIDWIATEATA